MKEKPELFASNYVRDWALMFAQLRRGKRRDQVAPDFDAVGRGEAFQVRNEAIVFAYLEGRIGG